MYDAFIFASHVKELINRSASDTKCMHGSSMEVAKWEVRKICSWSF